MSGSRNWRTTTFAGTSKTLDGTLERLFERSSKAEWVIKCPRCRHENISSAAEDLLNMIGPKGLICGLKKCGAPIDTRQGYWLHQFPDRMALNSGWHIPQPILPMHCEDARAWASLLRKRKEYREATFINECLGEACDVGTKLITINQIKKASVLPIRNNINKALKYCDQKSRYVAMAVGADWGGRGVDSDSFTAFAVVGLRTDDKIEIPYATKIPPSVDDTDEVNYVAMLYRRFKGSVIGHDYRSQGMTKDTMIAQKMGGKVLMPWSNEPTTSRFFCKLKKSPVGRRYVSVKRGGHCFAGS